ncbi:hypothetical protein [Enemella sp. A6]|uniref:hypothetical protein n=1 Tax=Enemella sp. A6 TaxID=3440152 RepID=UPI003EBA4FA1
MAWWKRRKEQTRKDSSSGAANPASVQHLTEFAQSRRGVEVFVEAPTNVAQASVLLIAGDGEWTRRQVPSPAWGHKFAEHLEIPSYDAGVVGYPQRMRDWNRAQKLRKKRAEND